jgi:hypothetical protein
MPDVSCKLRIEDSVESPPFALVDDVVVVVRTPRSSDFVTVEVGRILDCRFPPSSPDGVVRAPRPAPWIVNGWCGEVHSGEEVAFELGGRTYQLTLERTDETRCRPPWACYEFRLERMAADVGPATVG